MAYAPMLGLGLRGHFAFLNCNTLHQFGPQVSNSRYLVELEDGSQKQVTSLSVVSVPCGRFHLECTLELDIPS